MKKLLVTIAAVTAALVVLFVFKVIFLLTAKPTIAVDYVAEYNRLTKPENYDPCDNAAFDYQKAFDTLSHMPELVSLNDYKWPADMNEPALDAVEAWLKENIEVFKYIGRAWQKPYCWFERHDSNNEIPGADIFEFAKARQVAYALRLQAKIDAFEGRSDIALERLLQMHRLGLNYCCPGTLIEQLVGTGMRSLAYNTTVSILDRKEIDPDSLKRFQEKLTEQVKMLEPFDLSIGEKLFVLDCIQKMFTDDGKGGGKLTLGQFTKHTCKASDLKCFFITLNHPDRKETLEMYDRFIEEFDRIKLNTPYQMYIQTTNYSEYLEELTKDNYFVNYSTSSIGQICGSYYGEKITGQAIVSIIAVIRYKAKEGDLPDSLEKLVSKGYLQELPLDPYSDKPLVYKKTGDDFILYSVGMDFTDNGGTPGKWGEDGADQVFWPVQDCL